MVMLFLTMNHFILVRVKVQELMSIQNNIILKKTLKVGKLYKKDNK